MSSLDSSSDSTSNDIIELPISEEVFKHLQNARRFGMDIGGSLVKIAYSSSFERKEASLSEDESSSFIYSVNSSVKRIPTLNFIKFETKYIQTALEFIAKNLTSSNEFNTGEKSIKVTGGGAIKYKELISQKLGVTVEKEDEIKCLIKGCNFLIRNVPNEVFTIDHKDFKSSGHEFKSIESTDSQFPYLLINIGSGVSILKVDSEEVFQRIGGSCIGGATLWGLGSLLTNANGFDEILDLAENGDHTSVDMLVKDIYGGGYDKLGLNDNVIASSLGKTTRSALDMSSCTREEYLSRFKQEDLVRSILIMICFELSQLAHLHAKIHGIKKVYFGGYFIRKNFLTMKFLKHGISYWSQNEIECLFLRHEGYLGAVGAFLKCTEELDEKYSWYENYAHSSGNLGSRTRNDSVSFDCVELNREEKQLVVCPYLLDAASYVPDLVDLTKDQAAREYWLNCFERTINTYETQCVKTCYSGPEGTDENCRKRAQEFKVSYLSKIAELRKSPFVYGMLTVRSLLDLREHCMSEFGFFDVYLNEKREENRLGLEFLSERCQQIEKLSESRARWYELFKGVLAGNVYDYGAQAFIQKQQKGFLNSFQQALDTVEDNLLKISDYEHLVENIENYRSVCLFIDNSGFDVVLGILPLVIEFLKNGKKVILGVNSKPAINDITYAEMLVVVKKACFLNSALREAYYDSKTLTVIETGSASPCLDLSRIQVDVAQLICHNEVDLIILEGMGRAIHTNYNAKFKCDSLKIAVLKNVWLAEKFGLVNDKDKFPIIFKYERINNNL